MPSPTYPAEIALERRQYQELCSGLRNRGFQERAGGAEEKVRMGAGSVSVFSKSFTGFDIIYRAREDFGAHIRDITERRMNPSEIPLTVGVRFECEGGGSLSMLVRAHTSKSHRSSAMGGGRWSQLYAADLVPDPDSGIIIRNCISLSEQAERLRKDAGFGRGLDSREVYEALHSAMEGIPAGNSLKAEVVSGLAGYVQGWLGVYEFELQRMRNDRGALAAMALIADR